MRALRLLTAVALVACAACGEDRPDAAGQADTTAVDATDGTTAAPSAPASASSLPSTSPTPPTPPTPSTVAPTTAGPDLAAELSAGRTFMSSSVEGFSLVEGTQIQLEFDASNLAATGGCNQLSGAWSLEGDVLVVPTMAQTEMACEPSSLMDQDTWLASVLTSRPTLTLDGDTLAINAQGATVTLVDREVADPDRPLEGTVWTVDTLVTGDAASSLPAGARSPTLTFEDGTLSVDTGCNTGSGGYAVEGDTVTFDPIALTRMACTDPEASAMEQHMLTVLAALATVAIEAGTLTLTAGTNGVIAQAAG